MEDNNGQSDFWVLKLDNTGNIQWQNTIGGSGGDPADFFIQQTPDGGYALGGYSDSNISGDKTENGFGLMDYWLVKIDSTGNILWQHTYGGAGSDFLRSLQYTVDGGFILGGCSNSNISGTKTENTNGSYDYWIIKTDSFGTINGKIQLVEVAQMNFATQQTTDGGYILGGRSLSNASGDKTENSNGYTDYWIVKADGSGNILWQNTIGGSGNDAFYLRKQTSDNGFIISWFSDSGISGDKTENISLHMTFGL